MQVVIFKGKKVRLADHFANLLLKSGKAELPKKEKKNDTDKKQK